MNVDRYSLTFIFCYFCCMDLCIARNRKLTYSVWVGVFLFAFLFACDDYEREKGPKIIKFTGQVSGKNAAGITTALTNFPVTISFYEQYPLLNPSVEPVTVEFTTDAEGRYSYSLVDNGVYKGYRVGDNGPYYGSCTGAVSPVEVSGVLETQPVNENNLSLCIASLFVIQKHRTAGSAKTLHLSYKAKDEAGTVIFTPGSEITDSPTTELRFFPIIKEVEFTFEIREAGETVNTIVETHIPKPGESIVMDIDF